jgi:hypothetical protein
MDHKGVALIPISELAPLFWFPDYSELITQGTVVLGFDEASDSE